MPLKQELMASSLPWEAAGKLGFDTLTAVTAAGTTQATATALNCNLANVTTSSINAGVIVTEPNTKNYIYNAGPNTLTVYPPVGSTIVGLTVNSGFNIASGSAVTLTGAGTNLTPSLSF